MTTLNEYLKEVVELADSLGYDVMELDARGGVTVLPRHGEHKGNPDRESIEFRGLFVLETMKRCLRDVTGKAS